MPDQKKVFYLGAADQPAIKITVLAGSEAYRVLQQALETADAPMVPNSWISYPTNKKLAVCFKEEDEQIRKSITELAQEAHGHTKNVTSEDIIPIVASSFKIVSASNLETVPAAPITYHLLTEVIKHRHLPAKAITGEWLYAKRHDANLKPHDLRNEFNRHPLYVNNMTQRITDHIGMVKFMRYIHHLVNDALRSAEEMLSNPHQE